MALDVVLYLVAASSALAAALLLSRANRHRRLPWWRWPPGTTPSALALQFLALAAGLYAAGRAGEWLGDELSYGLALVVLVAPALAVNALHNRRHAPSGSEPT